MNPNIFNVLRNTPAVTALLGEKPTRIYPWSTAPEKVKKPYATYGVFNGLPENYLGNLPDIENLGTQIDIWAETVSDCEACFTAIRNALEPMGHMLNYQSTTRDPETQLFNARLEFDFWTER